MKRITPYVGGSMEIIHHGKVTKHAKDLDEYRQSFLYECTTMLKIVLRVAHKTCTMAMKTATFLGVDSYIDEELTKECCICCR